MTSTETETTIEALAGEAYDAFERQERDGGDTFLALRDDERDGWLTDMVREAHDDELPNDWRYEAVRAALGWIHDNSSNGTDDPHGFADGQVDTYTADRIQWLAGNLARASYCDEAAEEFGHTDGIIDMIGVGQYVALSRLFGVVVEHLEARLTDDADDDSEGN